MQRQAVACSVWRVRSPLWNHRETILGGGVHGMPAFEDASLADARRTAEILSGQLLVLSAAGRRESPGGNISGVWCSVTT